jgi:hypothetical protein
MECDPISSGLRNRVYLAARCANRRMTRMGELSQRERPRHHPPSPPFGGLLHYRWGSHHGLTQKAAMETSTVSCWSKACVRRQQSPLCRTFDDGRHPMGHHVRLFSRRFFHNNSGALRGSHHRAFRIHARPRGSTQRQHFREWFMGYAEVGCQQQYPRISSVHRY